jgi:hypothetical protein
LSALANLRTTGRIQKPPRLMIYGPQKIGKSTFGARAPAPVFIQIEDGLDGLADPDTGQPIEVAHFPQAHALGDVYDAMGALLNDDHSFQTLVIDSLDWLEPLIWKKTCDENRFDNIESPGYGKGYTLASKHWKEFLAGLNALRDRRGMGIILLAHAEIRKFQNPSGGDYDKYQPKLQKQGGALVQEWADIIGFANWEAVVVEQKTGFNQTTTKAKGSGRRLLHLEERPSYLAGSRYRLPPTIDFNWPSFASAFAAATAPAQPQAA